MSTAVFKKARRPAAERGFGREPVSAQIAALAELDNEALRNLWVKLNGTDCAATVRRSFLVRMLAYRIQEQAHGGLTREARQLLRRLADRGDSGKTDRPSPLLAPRLKPGSRLIRHFQGQVHEVTVMDKAFAYRGERYGSLSEIARHITGARWNGPAFFGLREPGKAPGKERAP